MKNSRTRFTAALVLTLTSAHLLSAQEPKRQKEAGAAKKATADKATTNQDTVGKAATEKALAESPGRPTLAARRTIEKFGWPQEATPEKLVWHNARPWKRISVTRKEIPHDFPKLHMDYLQMTINYPVPAKAVDALVAFDGSVTVDRTAGEISSRCDVEAANILTLNLCHDIITGKKDVNQARHAFGDAEVEFTLGQEPEIMKQLLFEMPGDSAADPDVPVVAGSSRRAEQRDDSSAGERAALGDAEILGHLVAINENEIFAAADAQKKKLSAPVLEYAKMLHMDHGKNLGTTLKLGQSMKVTPLETSAVDKLRVEGATQLAEMTPLQGEDFASAYLDAMVKGHTKVLGMIDKQFLVSARHAELQSHLKETRKSVAQHLEEAQRLQGSKER